MSYDHTDYGCATREELVNASTLHLRAELAGKTVTYVIPGDLLTDPDGTPIGAEPNTVFTATFDHNGWCVSTGEASEQ